MDTRKVENEPFPAVTICYPKTLKWPGIIKAASVLTTENMEKTFRRSKIENNDIYRYGLCRIWSNRYQYHNREMKVDYCEMLDKLFNNPSHGDLKTLLTWVLSYINQFNGDEELWKRFNQKANSWKWWDILKKDNYTEPFKQKVCSYGLTDCEDLPPLQTDQCDLRLPPTPDGTAFQSFDFDLHTLWGFSRYWNKLTAAQLLQFIATDFPEKAFQIKIRRKSLITYLKSASLPNETDLYLFWHFINGRFVNAQNNFGSLHSFNSDKTCFEASDCQETIDIFENMTNEDKSYYESLMEQPQIHGDMITDFVLAPLCSFGNDKVKGEKYIKKIKFQLKHSSSNLRFN